MHSRRWWILPLWICGLACSRDSAQGPAGVDTPTQTLSWIRPLDGSATADSLRIELTGSSEAPEGLTIIADDSTVALVARPPWTAAWLPHGPARRIRLAARAGALAAPEIAVDWSPNLAPFARILVPGGSAGGDIDSGDSIRCEALDPEDGMLGGSSIRWSSDRQGFLGNGTAIPVDCLIEASHRIRVRVSDRWLRTSAAEATFEAFRYSDMGDPADVLEDVRHAWLATDPERYAERLDPAFRFIFCPADRERDPSMPISWDLGAETGWFEALASRSRSIEGFAWRPGSIQESWIAGRRMAKAEIEAIDVRGVPVEGESLRVTGGRARVYLSRGSESGAWRIVEWIDCGASGLTSQGRMRYGSPMRS